MRGLAPIFLLGALVGLALSGCTRLVAVPPGIPSKGRVVREVTIQKNKKATSKIITAGLESHPPEGLVEIKFNVYDPDAVAADRLRIESFYQKQGFFSAKVTEVHSYPVRDRYIDLVFVVDEGKPTRIRMLGIAGLPKESPEVERQLDERLGVAIGDVYNEERYLEAKKRVALLLAESGHAFAELKGQVLVDRDSREAAIRLIIDAGPKVTLGKGTVTGLKDYPRDTVEKRIAWKPGDQYHPRLINKTRKNILSLQRFVSVREDLKTRTGTTVTPKVVVNESKKNELRLGGGFAVDPLQCRVRGRAAYVRRGFLGELNTLTVDARPAYAFPCFLGDNDVDVDGFVGELLVAIDRVDFPFDFFTSRVQVGYQFDELEAYTTDGPRLGVETRRRFFNQRVLATFGWGFNFDQFSEVRLTDAEADRTGIPRRKESQRVGFFKQSISVDFRDEVLAPTSGFFGRVEIEEGTPVAGGQSTYFRISPEVRGYYTLLYDQDDEGKDRARFTLAARVAGGSDLEGDSLPVTKRFYSGGASRHRGFPQRTLSPTGLNPAGVSLAVGGSSMFEANFEIRTLIYGRWGAVLFADGGDVTNKLAGVDVGNLHWALGGGLRIRTPVGPARVDMGVRANRTCAPGQCADPNELNPRPISSFSDRLVLHISLGEAF